MSKTAWIVIIIVVVVGGGLIWWYSSMSPSYTAPAAYQTPTSTEGTMPPNMNMSSTPSPTPTPAPTPAPSSQSVAVAISNFTFAPAALTVHKGTTVTWTNNDSVAHTVTGNNGGPSSGDIGQGATYSYTFNTVGSFPYYCAIHPYMKATVTVIN